MTGPTAPITALSREDLIRVLALDANDAARARIAAAFAVYEDPLKFPAGEAIHAMAAALRGDP
jgi:hypothetical protein